MFGHKRAPDSGAFASSTMIRSMTRGRGPARARTFRRKKTNDQKTTLFSTASKGGAPPESAAVLIAKLSRTQLDQLVLRKLTEGKAIKFDDINALLTPAIEAKEPKAEKVPPLVLEQRTRHCTNSFNS